MLFIRITNENSGKAYRVGVPNLFNPADRLGKVGHLLVLACMHEGVCALSHWCELAHAHTQRSGTVLMCMCKRQHGARAGAQVHAQKGGGVIAGTCAHAQRGCAGWSACGGGGKSVSAAQSGSDD